MQMQPYEFIVNFDKKAYCSDFNYRFIKPNDLLIFFGELKNFIQKISLLLKNFLQKVLKPHYIKNTGFFNSLQYVCDYFYKNPDFLQNEAKYPGYKFMLSNPKNKGNL